jgi:tetratricopeptide (TPR) repeat protein
MFKLYQKLLVLFLLLPVLGMSQNPMTNKIDSLKIELNKSKTDTGTINLLITLSQQYRNKGYIHLSEKTIQQAISLAKKINHKKALGNGYFAMGWIKQYSGDYDVAQKYYVQALGIQESINDDKGLAVTLTAMGIISIRFGNTDKSIKYYQRALSIKKSLRDSIGIAALFNNLAVVYYELEDFDKAIGYMEDARKIYKSIGNNEALGTILFNLGSYYYEKGDIKKGIKYFYEAHETTMKTEDFLSIAMSFNTLSNIYLDQKDYKKALSFNDRAVYYATKNGRIKDMLMDAYETYANIYSTIGNYHKAYKYQKDFMNIKDSIFNLEKSQQVTELAEKYESENPFFRFSL